MDGHFAYPLSIEREVIRLSESFFTLGLLSKDGIPGFTIGENSFSPSLYTAQDGSTSIQISLGADLATIARFNYGIFDIMRDVGGLFGALNGIATGIVFVLNFNGLHQWLTSKLFRVQSLSDHTRDVITQ